MSKFLPYVEALAVAQSFGLANQKEWYAWGKEGMRPANVPGRPDKTVVAVVLPLYRNQ